MLQTPSDSPFAAALRASKIVLVVPNRHCSVYTRLWCGYEAFLAHEEGKTILIAKDSNLQEIRRLGFAFSIFTLCSHVSEETSAFCPPTTDPIFKFFFRSMALSYCCVAWGGHSYAWLWLWWLELCWVCVQGWSTFSFLRKFLGLPHLEQPWDCASSINRHLFGSSFGEVWMLDVEGRQYKWPTHEIQAYFMRQGLAIYTWGTGCFFQVPRTSQMLHLDKNFWIKTSSSKCMLK